MVFLNFDVYDIYAAALMTAILFMFYLMTGKSKQEAIYDGRREIILQRLEKCLDDAVKFARDGGQDKILTLYIKEYGNIINNACLRALDYKNDETWNPTDIIMVPRVYMSKDEINVRIKIVFAEETKWLVMEVGDKGEIWVLSDEEYKSNYKVK